MRDTTAERAIQQAWQAGFATYCEKFPDAIRIVAREAAERQFRKDCEGKTFVGTFAEEAPKHAQLLLMIEHVKHNQYAGTEEG